MTEQAEGEQTRVTFTVKELLNRIDGKLDTMAVAIAQKADSEALIRLEVRLKRLEDTGVGNSAVGKYRRYLVATALAAVVAFGALMAVLFKVHISIP